MSSNNTSDPDRSKNNYLKQAKRAKQTSFLFNSVGIGNLGFLMWLAFTGHFKDNIKSAILLYLCSAVLMAVGTAFREKHNDIINKLNKKQHRR
ncbi:MAG: hypothetical protein IJN91_04795 [Alphaproteobacteria bacterium]|nr:hypothetical protein [Alphaproteobacteria bacterium]